MPIKNIGEKFMKEHKPVVLSDDSDGNINGFTCKWCNRTIYIKLTDDSIWCNSCQSETIIDKDIKPVKKSLKAETVDNSETFVVSIEYDPSKMAWHTKYDKPKTLKGGALALSKKGSIRFTSYYDSSEGK